VTTNCGTRVKLPLAHAKETAEADTADHVAGVLALLESVTTAIDAFSASLIAVADGATRSPLAIAATREQLHPDAPDAFTHALLVRSESGGASQTIDDKAFWMSDKVSIVATASITWFLLKTSDSSIVDSGIAGDTATAHGEIGDTLRVTFDDD